MIRVEGVMLSTHMFGCGKAERVDEGIGLC